MGGGLQNWATPWSLFDPLNRRFRFTLDVCASEHNHKCDKYFTEAQNGLLRPWAPSTCWCNPPYAQVEAWLEKGWDEARAGATVVFLLQAHTDTQWFRKYAVRGDLWFVSGRVRFKPPRGFTGKETGPSFASMIVVFTPALATGGKEPEAGLIDRTGVQIASPRRFSQESLF